MIKKKLLNAHYQKLQFKLLIITSMVILVVILIYTSLILTSQNFARRRFERNLDFASGSQLSPPPPPLVNEALIKDNFRQFERYVQRNLWIFSSFIWLLGSLIANIFIKKMLWPLQEKSIEQENFISNASHELKTPITTIKTELELFSTEKLSKNSSKSLAVIRQEILILQNLVAKLLQFDQIKVKNSQVFFDLKKLIEQEVKRFDAQLKVKKLRIKYIAPKVVKLKSDEDKIKQIITILIDNAVKYSYSEKMIEIYLKKNKDKLIIDFMNEGCHIPNEAKEKVFDRFYRVTAREVQKETGSGLGLYIAKQLAKQINGELILKKSDDHQIIFSLILSV